MGGVCCSQLVALPEVSHPAPGMVLRPSLSGFLCLLLTWMHLWQFHRRALDLLRLSQTLMGGARCPGQAQSRTWPYRVKGTSGMKVKSRSV